MNNNFNDEKNSSHSPTLKNNEDLQVFKKPTFTTKNCSDIENTSKKISRDLWKKKPTNLLLSFTHYLSIQPKIFLSLKEKCCSTIHNLNGFRKKNIQRDFFQKVYYFFMKPFCYFLGSCSYFIINYDAYTSFCPNRKIYVFEIIFLANNLFEIISQIIKFRTSKNHSKRNWNRMFKWTSHSLILLIFFVTLFVCPSEECFLVLNILRLLRLNRLFRFLKKIFFHKFKKITHEEKNKNEINDLLLQKDKESFASSCFYEICFKHFLFVLFCTNFAFLFVYFDDRYDFLDILNIFASYSRFSNTIHLPYSVSKDFFMICYFLGLILLFIHFFLFNSSNNSTTKRVFNHSPSLIVALGKMDLKKYVFCMKSNKELYGNSKFVFIFPEFELTNKKVMNELVNLNLVSEIFETHQGYTNLKYDDLLLLSEKIYFFIEKKNKNSLVLYQFFQKKHLSNQIYVYHEEPETKDYFLNYSNNCRTLLMNDIKPRMNASTVLFPGLQKFIFDLFKIYDINEISKINNTHYQTGTAKVSSLMEKLKFGDIFRILFFFSLEGIDVPVVLLGVFNKGQFIENNLFCYAVQENDELFFMSVSVEKHKKFIENFSSNELNIFRGIEDEMGKKMASTSEAREIIYTEKKIENIFMEDSENRFFESFLVKTLKIKFMSESKTFKSGKVNLPVFINLFNIQKKQIKKLNVYENHIIIFIHDQAFALKIVKVLRSHSNYPLFIFCNSEINHALWTKSCNFKEILFFYGKWRIKNHLNCIKIQKAAKIFIHKSINKNSGFDYESLYLLKNLKENFHCQEIYLDLQSKFSIDLLETKEMISPLDLKFYKNVNLISDYSFYDFFFKSSWDENIAKFFQYFLLTDEKSSLTFFKIKINEQLCNYFQDVGSLIWKSLQLRLGFPFQIIRHHNNQMIYFSPIVLNEKMCNNDEIIFFSSRTEENKIDTMEESKTRNPFLNSVINQSKEDNEKKIFTFTKVDEGNENKDPEVNDEEKNLEWSLAGDKVKEKIILKEQLINALKFSLKVCDELNQDN